MNNLLSSIFAKFIPGTDLYDALQGRLYYYRAPEGCTADYGIYFAYAASTEDTFSQDIEEVSLQFSFFSETLAGCNDLVRYCRALYHASVLSTGQTMQRVFITPARRSGGDDTANWQSDIEFNILNEV